MTMWRLARLTLSRYRWPALLAAFTTLLVGWAVAQTRPERWVAWSDVYVREPTTVHRLANPFTAAPREGEGLKQLATWLTSRERLVAMVKDTALVDRWGPGRPPLMQLVDRVKERVRGPPPEADVVDALAEIVDTRMNVELQRQHLVMSVEWSDPVLAQQLLASQLNALLRERETRDVRALEDAALALDEQVAGVQAEMVNRINELDARVLRARAEGRVALVDGERQQVLRDQDRAGQLLVRANEKHISAEVLRRTNALRFVVVRPALKPLRPEGAGRLTRTLVLGLATLVSALTAAFGLAIAQGTLFTRGQLTSRLGLRVLGWLQQPAPAERPSPRWWGWLGVLAYALATGLAVGLSRGNVAMALAPTLAAVALWQLWTRPLKWPLLGLMLLAVTIDDPTDRPYVGLWQSPSYALGRIFYMNVAWFTGFELSVMGLAVLMFLRRVATTGLRGLALDPEGASSPRILRRALLLSGATVGWLIVLGIARGGVFREALWQFRGLMMMPIVIMLALHAFEFPRDLKALAVVLGIGNAVKAAFGAYFIYRVASPMGANPPHTTGHNDTMIFVVATLVAFALVWERPTWRNAGFALLLFGFAAIGMRFNDRRIAYVDIVMALGFIFLISPMHRMKRLTIRAGVMMTPVLLLYLAAGWNSHSGIFKPVAKVRSIVAPTADSEEESSNVERDIENFNIAKSWERNMVFGQGFGHAFDEFIPSNDFAQSRFGHIGHNSVLWLLWIGGIVGYTGVLLYLAVAVFLIGRTLPRAPLWSERAALAVGLGIVLTYLMQAFGDMGMLGIQFAFFVSVAVAVAGRLAVRHEVLAVPPPDDRHIPIVTIKSVL